MSQATNLILSRLSRAPTKEVYLGLIAASSPVSLILSSSPANVRDPLTPEADAYPVPVQLALDAFQSRGWF